MKRFDAAACLHAVDERLETARRRAGGNPVLLAYDANAIQQFLTASDRLHAMRGASAIVKAFDRAAEKLEVNSGCLFAGGGRGLLLVNADRAREIAEGPDGEGGLVGEYRKVTYGGSLAVSTAALGDDQSAALRVLRQRMATAKDEAAPPRSTLFDRPDAFEMCQDCHQRPVDIPDRQRHEGVVAICARCDALYARGQQEARRRELGLSFEDVTALDKQRIGVISADGNEMGRLFASLRSVRQQAVVSRAVDDIFAYALDRARDAAKSAYERFGVDQPREQVVPVAGGDDVRAFVGPEVLLPFLETLVTEIESETDRVAGDLGLDDDSVRVFRRIGLGAGAVVAPFGVPARRLVEIAHDLEREAKKACGEKAERSAVRVMLLRSGDELADATERGQSRREALAFGNEQAEGRRPWRTAIQQARALAEVGKSQRAQLREAETLEPAERLNFFRYQVARTRDWQRYFDHPAVGIDWRRKDALTEAAMPSWTVQELARLVELERELEPERRAREVTR